MFVICNNYKQYNPNFRNYINFYTAVTQAAFVFFLEIPKFLLRTSCWLCLSDLEAI